MNRKVVIVLIAIVMTIALSGCRITIDNGGSIGLNRAEESSEKTVSSANIKNLKVSSAVGSIRVSTWDKNEIYIKATKINNGIKNKAELLEELKNAEIVYNQDNDTLTVKSFLPKFKNNGISVEFDISVPKNITVFDIDSEVGDVRLSKLEGQIDVVNNVGKIDISECTGNINLKAVTGDVTVRKSILKDGSTLTSNTGRLLFDGSIDSSGTYKMTTNVGKLDVTLPAECAFEIDASADVGSVDCEFNVDGNTTNKEVNRKVNGGGPKHILSNNVGGISINKQ
jgi:hypothetical protein